MCKTSDAEYIYYFADTMKGINIPKLTEAICKTGNAEYIYHFAKNIKDVNIEKLTDAICRIGEMEYLYCFLMDIKNADILKSIETMCNIDKDFILDTENLPNKVKIYFLSLIDSNHQALDYLEQEQRINDTSMILFPPTENANHHVKSENLQIQFCFENTNRLLTKLKTGLLTPIDVINEIPESEYCVGFILNEMKMYLKENREVLDTLFNVLREGPYQFYLDYLADLLINNILIPFEVDESFIIQTETYLDISQFLQRTI